MIAAKRSLTRSLEDQRDREIRHGRMVVAASADHLAERILSWADRADRARVRRAHDGVEEPLVSGGRQVVDAEGRPLVLRRYSDNLLVTLLKARRPERFKDRLAADLRADVKVGPDPDASFAAMVALLDGLAARKARGEPTPELDAMPLGWRVHRAGDLERPIPCRSRLPCP